jgi:membrane protein
MPQTFKGSVTVLRDAFKLFLKHDPLRMGGATAFFTMFALPPIIIIIVQVFGLLIGPEAIKHQLFTDLSGLFGTEAARQIVAIIRAFRKLASNTAASIFGFIFLLFVATTLFKVIKGCINQIWEVEKAKEKTLLKPVQSRLASLFVIIIAGVLLSLGILLETIEVLIGQYFIRFLPSISNFLNGTLNFILSTLIVSVWFLIIFRYLPDGRPKWKVAWVGALFTSVLFSLGKIALHFLLSYNNITSVYGVSASIVLLLLFIFYSAMMLYYGAAFTKTWSVYNEQPIKAEVAS